MKTNNNKTNMLLSFDVATYCIIYISFVWIDFPILWEMYGNSGGTGNLFSLFFFDILIFCKKNYFIPIFLFFYL